MGDDGLQRRQVTDEMNASLDFEYHQHPVGAQAVSGAWPPDTRAVK
jgi:hypothetical protein